MNYKPLTFSKNYEERLKDLSRILSPSSIKTSAIKTIWSDFVEMQVDPIGWLAFWKISRNLCQDLKIDFPCSVIVYVEQVNPTDLSCLVSIREVEDESLQLPERMADVPLIELYPIQEQDSSSAICVSDTAELLDNLRFFYKHIWMPWDSEMSYYDDDSYWVENHLQPRLQLYFSLVERKLPHWVGYKVRLLVTEGRQAETRIQDMEADMEDDSECDNRFLDLTELHHSLITLKNRYMIYENARLLKAHLERTERIQKSLELKSGVAEVNLYLVLSVMTRDRFAALSDKIQQRFTDDKNAFRMFTSLQEVLVMVPVGGEIWLTKGERDHTIYDLGVMEDGGTITGVEEGVVITDDSEGSCTLDLLKGTLNLSQLTVKLTFNTDIIKVRAGAVCSLCDVRLEGSPVIDGIDVFSSGSLSAVNCTFTSYYTAITGDAHATLHLTNCTFTDNKVALQVKQGCLLTMENCTIAGSKQYGILLLVPRPLKDNTTSINAINSVENMKESGTTCRENATDLHMLLDSWNCPRMEDNFT